MSTNDTELWRQTAIEVVELLKHKKVTPTQLIDVVEQRITETDALINAIPIRCFERARQHALKLEHQGWPTDPKPGYLFGLPVVIKDLTAVAGVRFTQGSLIYSDRIATENDPLVDLIEANGGIIIGKSNVPEFGVGAQTHNPIFGATKTPFDISKTAGGSSGGSTAALAAGQVWLATGTDLGGSQRIPASFCGVVGLRPSIGVVPQASPSTVPPSPKNPGLHGVSGPLARTVPDLALLLDAISGQHPRDPLSKPKSVKSYSALVQPGACPLPKCIAWSPDLGGIALVNPEVAAICRTAAHWFTELGCQVVQATPKVSDVDTFHGVLRASKFTIMAPFLKEPYRSKVKPEILWEIEEGLKLTTQQIKGAEKAHATYMARCLAFLDEYNLLLLPSVIVPPYDAETKWLPSAVGRKFKAYYEWQVLSYAISLITGAPALSLPVGFTKAGLPVGLQIVGQPGQDAVVLAAAAAYERAHNHWQRVPVTPI